MERFVMVGFLVFMEGGDHFAVGMTNSAPLGVLSGQRCMMDFWRV
jgi:hypothetical protein